MRVKTYRPIRVQMTAEYGGFEAVWDSYTEVANRQQRTARTKSGSRRDVPLRDAERDLNAAESAVERQQVAASTAEAALLEAMDVSDGTDA